MRTSIATVSLSGTLVEKLDAIAAAGFDGIEIFENDLLTSPLAPEELRARLADLGLGLDLFQPFRDFEAVAPDRLEANLRRARRKLALMERLGADTVLVCSNVGGDPIDDDALAAEQLHRLAALAGEHGMRVAYEALAWGRHVSDYRHAWRIVEMADHPALGTCIDSFHILSVGSDPAGIEAIPAEKIFFLQLADAPVMAMDVLQWSRHHRCFPGQGGLDVVGLTAHVLRAGYTGPLSLEVFNDVFRQSPADRTAVDAFRSLTALEDATAALLGTTAPPGTVPARAQLTVLPPAGAPTGVAFVELAVPEAGALDDLLTALGFTRVGRHLTKPVDLWQQGRARLLTNAAAGHPHVRLKAVGLEVADPEAAVRRAVALSAPVLPRWKAEHEVVLNSVAAPDGTEVFFCRTEQPDHPSWIADFVPTGAAAAPGHGLRADHVALTQPWQFFDEATLFYRSVLELEPQDSLEVPDPYGLLRSRAVANADGTVRIALNVQPSHYDGADPTRASVPLQHVAAATDDILASARALRESGAPLLRVSDNYYDDLDARHDLDPALLAQLRELGVLYDRDGEGEFFQLFTETVGEVFFEVVQRVGGYAGYGATNAPFRLSAQHA